MTAGLSGGVLRGIYGWSKFDEDRVRIRFGGGELGDRHIKEEIWELWWFGWSGDLGLNFRGRETER